MILHYAADRRSVAVVLATIVLLALQLLEVARHPALWVAALVGIYMTLLVNHNHQHLPMFRHPWLNRCWTLVLSLTQGLPGTLLVPLHNRNHHQSHGGPDDFMGVGVVERLPRLLRLPLYPVAASLCYLPRKRRLLAELRRHESPLWRRLLVERLLLAAFCVTLLVWKPWDSFLCLFLPWILAQYWVINANYIQHVGCDHAAEQGHSRDFTGRLLNWLTFNGGYHIEHHDHPAVHWSLLPDLHRAQRAALEPELVERSFLGTVLRLALGRSPQRRAGT